MLYRIHEIFRTLQGEGYYTGTPAVFIRMSGCNLACPWCDTDFASHRLLSAEQIAKEALDLIPRRPLTGKNLLVLTGGEPSLQTDYTLVETLRKAGFYVAVETNGTHALPSNINWITCSPKEGSHIALTRADELKVVFSGDSNPEPWLDLIHAHHHFLQPLHSQENNTTCIADTVKYTLAHPHWRLSLQTHKLIGIK